MHKIILVADAKIAKFYESSGLKVGEMIKSIKAEDFGIDHSSQELHTGFAKKQNSPSHFYDPSSNPKDLNRDDFSKVILDVLVQLQKDHKYEEIIIAASPKMLGDIRDHYPKSLKNIPLRDISKDLVQSSPLEIEKIIFHK
ncbi:MAG: host attachment protein [Alphaproteobacteria bacterium]|nr:host attachment protein [Alphaproteobacteria bacterium]